MKWYASDRSRLFVPPLLESKCFMRWIWSRFIHDSPVFAVRWRPSAPARHTHAGKMHLLLGALPFNVWFSLQSMCCIICCDNWIMGNLTKDILLHVTTAEVIIIANKASRIVIVSCESMILTDQKANKRKKREGKLVKTESTLTFWQFI